MNANYSYVGLLLIRLMCSDVPGSSMGALPSAHGVVPEAARGEFGAGLDYLRQHYSRANQENESNHFIDLWSEQTLRNIAFECNLTNNHALFINSHGGRLAGSREKRYAYYPHQSLLGLGEKLPSFSAADIAEIVGRANAPLIHNIIISACNEEGAFEARELRNYFINATNIVHVAAGALGYQPMFLQVLTTPSLRIQPVYETCAKTQAGKPEFFTGNVPSSKTTRFTPYIAELFRPGEINSYRTQTAGRELLAPKNPSLMGE